MKTKAKKEKQHIHPNAFNLYTDDGGKQSIPPPIQLYTDSSDTMNSFSITDSGTATMQRTPTQTFDFEPEEITSAVQPLGGAGRRPYDIIQDHVSSISSGIDTMRENELGAINQFLTHMSFSSSQDAQPDVLGAVFKQVGNSLMGAAIGSLPSVGGIAASEIFDIVNAMTSELERAAAAQQSYNLASFMTNIRNSTLNTYQGLIRQIQLEWRNNLQTQFVDAEGIWEEGNQNVVGEKATFLRSLEAKSRTFLQNIPRPIQFEEAILTKWITDRRAGGMMQGFRSNGLIELKYDAPLNDGQYSFTHQSSKLFTATQSGQAADMLTRVMREQNKKVYELGIPVRIMLRVPNNMPGGRSYYAVWVRSRDDFDRSHWHRPANRAWQAMPWDPIDSISNVTGG